MLTGAEKEYTITKPNGEKVVKTKKWFDFVCIFIRCNI